MESQVWEPLCLKCGGCGLEPTLEAVGCLACDGTGNLGGSTIRYLQITRQNLIRIVLGEFRSGRK